MDWPLLPALQPTIICACSRESLGGTGPLTGAASGTWPTSNRAYYIPFRIAVPLTIAQFGWLNGGAVSGNCDAGVYSADGTKLVSTGSTAQATINVIQLVNITDFQIGPGLFYLAMAMNNTTGAVLNWPATNPRAIATGMAIQDTAFALPATATFAQVAGSFIPSVFLTTKATM